MSTAGLDSVEFPDPFVVYADGTFKVSDLVSAFDATGASVSSLTSGLVSAGASEASSSPDSSALSTTGADTG